MNGHPFSLSWNVSILPFESADLGSVKQINTSQSFHNENKNLIPPLGVISASWKLWRKILSSKRELWGAKPLSIRFVFFATQFTFYTVNSKFYMVTSTFYMVRSTFYIGQCKTQTVDFRLQTGGKVQTEGKMQTEDCRSGVKRRLGSKRINCLWPRYRPDREAKERSVERLEANDTKHHSKITPTFAA